MENLIVKCVNLDFFLKAKDGKALMAFQQKNNKNNGIKAYVGKTSLLAEKEFKVRDGRLGDWQRWPWSTKEEIGICENSS